MMTRSEFLNELERLLHELPESERKEILFDYNEHFEIGKEEGKSQHEVSESLGNPRTIAKELKADFRINQAKENQSVSNISKAVIATLSLGFFNLVFVLGPFFGLVGIMIGLYATTLALIVTPIFILIKALLAENDQFMESLFLIMATGGLGVLLSVGMIYLTKFVYIGVVKYLQFNVKIVRGYKA
ncbi:HAAS domain-containing protein [Alkalihalobacillus sp. AL-G]|uniref:HAAS signaling domain-containing protein n=1 Tax=Alkalihalobacillus sp. AL-G TaxID=2926399 RepID=UPI00272A2F62|nr:DUF1700 domain-containing protein [Alkalihalobacillus sp. AL-G]WLD92761.1 DUF1700 domain-containing protein [Alkalihalobacillus sp. AL-G]